MISVRYNITLRATKNKLKVFSEFYKRKFITKKNTKTLSMKIDCFLILGGWEMEHAKCPPTLNKSISNANNVHTFVCKYNTMCIMCCIFNNTKTWYRYVGISIHTYTER